MGTTAASWLSCKNALLFGWYEMLELGVRSILDSKRKLARSSQTLPKLLPVAGLTLPTFPYWVQKQRSLEQWNTDLMYQPEASAQSLAA